MKRVRKQVRWKNLAKSTDTIVVMMGLSRLGIICKQLIKWRDGEKNSGCCNSRWYNIKTENDYWHSFKFAQKVKRYKIEPPSIIIIGKVVSLSKTIGWRKK